MKKRKLLITGALGHLGSSILRDYRIQMFDEIIVIDNLNTQNYCSLFNLKYPISFYQLDITKDNLDKIIKNSNTVIHLAAIVNAGETIDKDGKTKLINYIGTKKVVEASEKNNVTNFIYASTTSVYGPESSLRNETSKGLYPQTPYAKYKLKGEDPLLKSKILNKFIFRFGTVFEYSIGMRIHTAMNRFIWEAITKKPLIIWKPGTGLRPYASLKHVRDSIFNILIGKKESGIYNIVTHHWNPKQIIKIIKNYIPDLKTEYVTPRIINQDSYIIDFNKAIEVSLYETNKKIAEEQLNEYIEIMKNHILKGIIYND